MASPLIDPSADATDSLKNSFTNLAGVGLASPFFPTITPTLWASLLTPQPANTQAAAAPPQFQLPTHIYRDRKPPPAYVPGPVPTRDRTGDLKAGLISLLVGGLLGGGRGALAGLTGANQGRDQLYNTALSDYQNAEAVRQAKSQARRQAFEDWRKQQESQAERDYRNDQLAIEAARLNAPMYGAANTTKPGIPRYSQIPESPETPETPETPQPTQNAGTGEAPLPSGPLTEEQKQTLRAYQLGRYSDLENTFLGSPHAPLDTEGLSPATVNDRIRGLQSEYQRYGGDPSQMPFLVNTDSGENPASPYRAVRGPRPLQKIAPAAAPAPKDSAPSGRRGGSLPALPGVPGYPGQSPIKKPSSPSPGPPHFAPPSRSVAPPAHHSQTQPRNKAGHFAGPPLAPARKSYEDQYRGTLVDNSGRVYRPVPSSSARPTPSAPTLTAPVVHKGNGFSWNMEP